MADAHSAEIDTLIDISPADITTAADWLEKLKTGFEEASTSMDNTAIDRLDLTGEFGIALNDYINDLCAGCDDAFTELGPTIDTINSWHDQVVWRQQDMAGYRDDARTGNLNVRDDRYIQAPDSVPTPSSAPPKGATSKQINEWKDSIYDYSEYQKQKQLFDNLQEYASETRKKTHRLGL